MISALTGQLRRVEQDRAHLQAGPVLYELLVPAADAAELQLRVGEEITFHTIVYFEGDASRGNLEPRLIGFLRPDDRRFFKLFTTVKGIGPKGALKAFTVPVGRIAHAIESRDTRYLVQLKGVGKRTAELIVAELAGKLSEFALAHGGAGSPSRTRRAEIEEFALAAAVQLGIQRPEADRLLDRAMQTAPGQKTPDEILREMLRLRTTRA